MSSMVFVGIRYANVCTLNFNDINPNSIKRLFVRERVLTCGIGDSATQAWDYCEGTG